MPSVESYWTIAIARRGFSEVSDMHHVVIRAKFGGTFSKPMNFVMDFSSFSVLLQPYKDEH